MFPVIIMKKDVMLNYANFSRMRLQEPQQFDWIRFDPTNDCNVRCVYCHANHSKLFVNTDDFSTFLDQNVISVDNFQIGCGQEPTMDPRLTDLMGLIAASKAKPTGQFKLQTNGILLHQHDLVKMRDAGLTDVSVSIDAADPEINKLLRGGTSMAKVHSNILAVRKTIPEVKIVFVTTVTKLNVDAMQELVAFGLDLGVARFAFREMFYFPENKVVDHAKMRALLLGKGDFEKMKKALRTTFGGRAVLKFLDEETLESDRTRMRSDSLL